MLGTFVVGLQCCILKWMSFSDGLKMELGLTFSFLTPLLATVYRGSTHEMAQTMNGLKMAMNDSFVTETSRFTRITFGVTKIKFTPCGDIMEPYDTAKCF